MNRKNTTLMEMVYMAMKDTIKEKDTGMSTPAGGSAATGTEAVPGAIEVTVRIMGEDGTWIGRTIQVNTDVTVDTFDVSSRNGYLASFHTLEQAMVHARNEASRQAAEAFLTEVGKKQIV